MRTCYGSHNKYPRKASHRISRDHPERGFYKLLPANKAEQAEGNRERKPNL